MSLFLRVRARHYMIKRLIEISKLRKAHKIKKESKREKN